MRPLPENHSTSSSPRRPTMRLRDPLTTYKSFESSTGASASPSPSANGGHSNASTIKSNHNNGYHHHRQSSSSPVSTSNIHQHHSATASPLSQNHRDSQPLLLHRTTSLDSLANSSEDPEDDINTTTTEEDVGCDDDDLSDADSIGDFGSTTTTTTAQIHHRKSDLETLQPDQEDSSHITPQPAVIKAYLEKTAQRNYKTHEFKKRPDADEERKRADKLFIRELDESFNNHEMSVDSDETGSFNHNNNNNNGTMSSTMSSGSGGSGSIGSGGSTKSSIRRLSVASSGSMGRMETIIEEPPAIESKVSVKEILARFETLNSLEV